LGRLLKSPVIILVDVTMATRTMAALIMGCQRFDPDLKIVAVILNRVAGSRQETVVRNSIDQYCGIPVLGAIPKLKGTPFPERHMGLVPQQERKHAQKGIAWARRAVEDHIDLDALWKLAHDVEALEDPGQDQAKGLSETMSAGPPRIGFIRDRSFWFYYPENLEQLKNLGALLVEVNSITDPVLPDLDALYVGGGFPETQAEALAENSSFRSSLKQGIGGGLPVYAECGGLMYLGESLVVKGRTFPMVNALPLQFVLEQKPQGHGYTILEVKKENPYFPVGEVLRGHEFHYSKPLIIPTKRINPVFKVRRGFGLDGQRDGLSRKNLLATYTHMHAAGTPLWGKGLFKAARRFQKLREKKPTP
jgi:cobyrinic acid a,c-diamide synthase